MWVKYLFFAEQMATQHTEIELQSSSSSSSVTTQQIETLPQSGKKFEPLLLKGVSRNNQFANRQYTPRKLHMY